MDPAANQLWNLSGEDALVSLRTQREGLSSADASQRLKDVGENVIKPRKTDTPLLLLLNQFKSPLLLIMLAATAISAATGDWLDSLIILAIVFGSAILSFFQEYSASHAVEALRNQIQMKCDVYRDGKLTDIPAAYIVPGDIVRLSAGSMIPADGIVLTCQGFQVNQSALTGEALPVEKSAHPSASEAPLGERGNCVYMGTTVTSGSADVLITLTGSKTELGSITDSLAMAEPPTEFDNGIRDFGKLLMAIMLVMTVAVFAVNVLFNKPVIDSLLFSVALAVGITPQLLPAIVNITLSRGSKVMAAEGVIVRRLTAIENFGSMDILCTDKTGTLTEGRLSLNLAADAGGNASAGVLRAAWLNASLQTGLKNPLDEAILAATKADDSGVTKRGEIAYDFFRKRLSVVAEEQGVLTLITKGALHAMIEVCSTIDMNGAAQPLDDAARSSLQAWFETWSSQGFRVLGVASRSIELRNSGDYDVADEREMTFLGFLLFLDQPKTDIRQTIADLTSLHVSLRIITGDNALIAKHIASSVGLKADTILTGADILKLDDAGLKAKADTTDLFAEVDPLQKERIILALKGDNHVVGYMGDGINDAPALHAADVGISVDSAVDVAKEAADFVLLKKSLNVLGRGIRLGRASFSNTLKYIYITASANFGNMFSMAGASLFMPFLPLLPKQILLINFMTDFPAMTISGDSVDEDSLRLPRRWDIRRLRTFMIVFGLISSVFDYLTFGTLLLVFGAGEILFQSGWFVLSIVTELMQLLIMRTHKPFYKSRPAPFLLFSTLAVGLVSFLMPTLGFTSSLLGIAPLPPLVLLALIGIAVLYIITTEIAKHAFFRTELEAAAEKTSKSA